MHQALAALLSLSTEGCAKTVRSTRVGVRNVIHEFTKMYMDRTTLLFARLQTGFFGAYCIGKYGSTSYDPGKKWRPIEKV